MQPELSHTPAGCGPEDAGVTGRPGCQTRRHPRSSHEPQSGCETWPWVDCEPAHGHKAQRRDDVILIGVALTLNTSIIY